MPRQESVGSLRDWIDGETRHIDVVASWESLCDTYDSLRFSDRLSDAERLEEYKWIVQQMNSFLSKMGTKLRSCRDAEAMLDLLAASFTPTGKVDLGTRRSLVYQKLRQQWVRSAIMELQAIAQEEMMETEDPYGE